MVLELLREGAKALGLYLGPQHLAAFETYYRELYAWNQRFNLTAITSYEEIQTKHFLDSLSCLLALPLEDGPRPLPDTVPVLRSLRPLRCADVGSGAGFPGLPLKILLPELKLTLVEATGKKVTFLRHMVQLLNLSDVQVLHARAEEVGQQPEHREGYDLVVARAVAQMPVLAEYCLPLCRVGGRFVAQKGEGAHAEVEAAHGALERLGGRLGEIKAVHLPGLGERYLVVVEKVAQTPPEYPRRPGVPAKRPLGGTLAPGLDAPRHNPPKDGLL